MSATMSPSSSPRPRTRRGRGRAVEVLYELPLRCRCRQALKPGAPQVHPSPGQPRLRLVIGDEAATTAAFKNARPCHQARHRQQPAGPQRHGAARRDRPTTRRTTISRCYTTSQNPHVARLVMRPSTMSRRRQAARHRAGCRRRLRLQDLHLSEEIVCVWASKKRGGVPVKWTADRTEAS
jgi:carbon-monoxide dehydrogenase large subunit